MSPFADICVALKIAARDAAIVKERDEYTAHAIGLFPETARAIVGNRCRQAELLGEAHSIFKAMLPIENTMRAVLKVSET